MVRKKIVSPRKKRKPRRSNSNSKPRRRRSVTRPKKRGLNEWVAREVMLTGGVVGATALYDLFKRRSRSSRNLQRFIDVNLILNSPVSEYDETMERIRQITDIDTLKEISDTLIFRNQDTPIKIEIFREIVRRMVLMNEVEFLQQSIIPNLNDAFLAILLNNGVKINPSVHFPVDSLVKLEQILQNNGLDEQGFQNVQETYNDEIDLLIDLAIKFRRQDIPNEVIYNMLTEKFGTLPTKDAIEMIRLMDTPDPNCSIINEKMPCVRHPYCAWKDNICSPRREFRR